MEDKDIIMALECCIAGFENCEKCPYGGIYCLTEKGESLVMRDALDLIKRQKAEVERLKEELDGETVKNMRLGHEIEEFKTLCDMQDKIMLEQKAILEAINDEFNPLPFETDFDKAIKNAKSEAIKKYKEKVKSILISKGLYLVVIKNALDEAEKKMTEGRENG